MIVNYENNIKRKPLGVTVFVAVGVGVKQFFEVVLPAYEEAHEYEPSDEECNNI